mmetsp:Transcript_18651/g.43981  ORF Transcript_18651/g.43981 Transcript_18651/m.43981 type:complete len:531 (-) Transcript_18651:3443-5035(-)
MYSGREKFRAAFDRRGGREAVPPQQTRQPRCGIPTPSRLCTLILKKIPLRENHSSTRSFFITNQPRASSPRISFGTIRATPSPTRSTAKTIGGSWHLSLTFPSKRCSGSLAWIKFTNPFTNNSWSQTAKPTKIFVDTFWTNGKSKPLFRRTETLCAARSFVGRFSKSFWNKNVYIFNPASTVVYSTPSFLLVLCGVLVILFQSFLLLLFHFRRDQFAILFHHFWPRSQQSKHGTNGLQRFSVQVLIMLRRHVVRIRNGRSPLVLGHSTQHGRHQKGIHILDIFQRIRLVAVHRAHGINRRMVRHGQRQTIVGDAQFAGKFERLGTGFHQGFQPTVPRRAGFHGQLQGRFAAIVGHAGSFRILLQQQAHGLEFSSGNERVARHVFHVGAPTANFVERKIVDIPGWITLGYLFWHNGHGKSKNRQRASYQTCCRLYGIEWNHFLTRTNRSKFEQQQGPFPSPPITQNRSNRTKFLQEFLSLGVTCITFQCCQLFKFRRLFEFVNVTSVQELQRTADLVAIHSRVGQGRFARQ